MKAGVGVADVQGPPPLIHIGYHKTASSLLQEHLLCDEKRGFLAVPRPVATKLVHAGLARISPHGEVPEALLQEFSAWRRKASELAQCLVFSHERLSGYPASGGYDAARIADALARVLPGAKILIVIREQRAMIRSMYGQYVRDGGSARLGRFLAPLDPGLVRVPRFDRAFYAYDQAVRGYQERFGADNVLVLPYELLSEDAPAFAGAILDFAGSSEGFAGASLPQASVNAQRPLVLQALTRVANALFSRNQLGDFALLHLGDSGAFMDRYAKLVRWVVPPARERRLAARQRELIAQHVDGFYDASNRRTCELTGLDLGRFGYSGV